MAPSPIVSAASQARPSLARKAALSSPRIAPRPTSPAVVDTTDDDPSHLLEADRQITTPRVSIAPGEWIRDRFQVKELLGDGALGRHFSGLAAASGRPVAIQIISETLVVNEGECREFAARVQHHVGRGVPGCVVPIEVLVVSGQAVVVTPWVDGVTLRAVIDARRARQQAWTPEEVLRVLLAVVGATQALHSATPHGALSPENIVLSPRGVFVTDCVVGVCLPPDRVHARLVDRPALRPYLPPEMSRGKRPTASADLFAIGAMALELLGGSALVDQTQTESVPSDVLTAAEALLDRDPARRPPAIHLLLDALARAAGFEGRPQSPALIVPIDVSVTATSAPDLDEDLLLTRPDRSAAPSAPTPVTTGALQQAVIPPRPPAAGRLSSSTASLPRGTPSPSAIPSGPPASMAVKSGPPRGTAPPPVPPPQAARPQPTTRMSPARPPPQPPPSARPPASRRGEPDPDGIDPRLLRAAKVLDAERRRGGGGRDPSR